MHRADALPESAAQRHAQTTYLALAFAADAHLFNAFATVAGRRRPSGYLSRLIA